MALVPIRVYQAVIRALVASKTLAVHSRVFTQENLGTLSTSSSRL